MIESFMKVGGNEKRRKTRSHSYSTRSSPTRNADHYPYLPFLITHSLVLSTLTPLLTTEPTRKCFRLIGGVLVERTVSEVEPDLRGNLLGVSPSVAGWGGWSMVGWWWGSWSGSVSDSRRAGRSMCSS
jgi:hypothetical protein